MVEVDFKDRGEFDEAERELCPDGNCTGLIGVDGHCKLCGLAKDGTRSAPAHQADDSEDSHETAGEPGETAFDDDADRKLCPDGNCTGLVGSDGRCKVCGAS